MNQTKNGTITIPQWTNDTVYTINKTQLNKFDIFPDIENNYIIVYNLFDQKLEELNIFFASYFINPSNGYQLNNSRIMRSQSAGKSDVYDIKCNVDGKIIHCAIILSTTVEEYYATLSKITWPDLIPTKGEVEKTLVIPFQYVGMLFFQNNSFVAYSSIQEGNYQYYVSILDYGYRSYSYLAFTPPSIVNTVYQLYMLPNKTLIIPVININVKTNSISEMTLVSRDLSGYNEEGK